MAGFIPPSASVGLPPPAGRRPPDAARLSLALALAVAVVLCRSVGCRGVGRGVGRGGGRGVGIARVRTHGVVG